jgi:DNA repair protein RecN (Recombination protein N)
LRDYLRRLDLDPTELRRVETRLSAIHDIARRHRVRPEALPALLAETEARLVALGGPGHLGDESNENAAGGSLVRSAAVRRRPSRRAERLVARRARPCT